MINLYLGNTGSGKSLHTAKDIRFALEHGQLVIANYRVDLTKFKLKKDSKFVYLSNKQLEYPYELVKVIKEYQEEHGYRRMLIVIDEAQMLFDNRKWNIAGREQWMLFFTHHRKITRDKGEVLLLTQREASIDPKVADIVEFKSYHHKTCNMGTIMFLIGLFTGDRLHHYVTYWGPGKNVRTANKYFLRKNRDCDIYDTFDEFELFDDIEMLNK